MYKADTWYDAAGRIIFTASKGLVGSAGRNSSEEIIMFKEENISFRQ
jgi:hypothetical protein